MHFSLISVGKLDDEGYHSHLGKARGKKNNTLYKTEVRLVKGEVKKPKPFNEEQVDLGPVSPNSMGYNEHRKVVQEEWVDTVDRNDEFAVDDVEENPTVDNDGLE
uniref:Uncharacterized protein n=1 Tax=Vitis vinifera TaxID=29760 RepID=A5ALL5_VITVI|nr:hypothetical protein VITISV_015641 [Vitis vinifera]